MTTRSFTVGSWAVSLVFFALLYHNSDGEMVGNLFLGAVLVYLFVAGLLAAALYVVSPSHRARAWLDLLAWVAGVWFLVFILLPLCFMLWTHARYWLKQGNA